MKWSVSPIHEIRGAVVFRIPEEVQLEAVHVAITAGPPFQASGAAPQAPLARPHAFVGTAI